MAKKGTLTVRVVGDTKPLEKNLKGIQSTLGSAMKVAGAAAAAGAAILVKDSIRAFSDLEQSVGGTEAVFGNLSKTIDDVAKTSAQSMGLSEAEFRTATTAIGGQLKRMTGDVDLAAEQSIELTRVAADLAATYGGTTAEAVQALGAAFRGEADPAERFNLDLKIGRQNAKAVELGLAKTETTVSDYARAQATLALIMEQSSDAQGQFAREADTVAGQTQIVNAQMENQKAIIGQQLAPIWVAFLTAISDSMQGVTHLWFGFMDMVSEFRHLFDQTARSADDVRLAFQEAGVMGVAGADQVLFAWGQVQESTRETDEGWQEFVRHVNEMNLPPEEIDRLRGASDEFLRSLGFTNAQIDELRSLLETELVAAARTARDQGIHAARDGMDDLRESTEGAATATQTFIDKQLALVDPVFAAIQAQRGVEEAQRAMNEAIRVYGERSPQAIDATARYVEEVARADAAAAKFAEEGGPTSTQAFENIAREAGISEETIAAVKAAIDRLNDNPVRDPFRHIRGLPGLPDRFVNPNIPAFDSGGIVPGRIGSPQLVLAHGGETVVPTHKFDMAPVGNTYHIHTLEGPGLARRIEMESAYRLALGG